MANERLNSSRHPLQPAGPLVGGTWLLSARLNHPVDSPMNYYKRHIGDYARRTMHLGFLEDAAYNRLLDVYYTRESPIPHDIQQACRLVRASSKAEKGAVESVLKEFFVLEEDGWHNKRCDEELVADQAFIAKQRANGRASAAKRASNQTPTVVEPESNGGSTVGQPPTPTPTPNLKKGESKPSPDDPDALIFGLGIQLLGEGNRSLLGKLVKDHGRPTVAAKIGELAAANPKPVDAKTWLLGCLKTREDKPTRFKTA